MKTFLYSVLAIAFIITSCKKDKPLPEDPAQECNELTNTIVSGSDCVRFQRQFYGANLTDAKRVKQAADGGYIFSGQYTINNQKRNFILKTDCFGATLSVTEVNSPLNLTIADFTEISSGGYMLICVHSQVDVFNVYLDNYLMKIDDNGNVLWGNFFDTGNSAFPQHIKEVANEEFIFAGFDANNGGYLTKVDATGDSLWTFTLGTSKIFDFNQKPNGNIVVCGSNNNDIFLAELTTSGATVWMESIDKETLSNTATNIEILNNEILISGYTSASNGSISSSFVMNLDATGNENWYSTAVKGNLSKTHDGKILCSSSNSSSTQLTKIEPSNGSIIFNKSFSMTSPAVSDVQLTSDNGFIILGYEFINGPPLHYFMLKTDEFGE